MGSEQGREGGRTLIAADDVVESVRRQIHRASSMSQTTRAEREPRDWLSSLAERSPHSLAANVGPTGSAVTCLATSRDASGSISGLAPDAEETGQYLGPV
jgi:hypothetical protein